MSHTPGPWVRRNIASNDMYVGPANDGGAPNVAIIPKRITRTDDEQLANARLIAAAPELLEALSRLVDKDLAYFDGSVMNHCISMRDVDIARDAIAKATGEAT